MHRLLWCQRNCVLVDAGETVADDEARAAVALGYYSKGQHSERMAGLPNSLGGRNPESPNKQIPSLLALTCMGPGGLLHHIAP